MSGVTLEWPAWVIAGNTGPIQNISSRVRSVQDHYYSHDTHCDSYLQLFSAAVRYGLQQGLLPSPVSLDQDAGALWAQAWGLPTWLLL